MIVWSALALLSCGGSERALWLAEPTPAPEPELWSPEDTAAGWTLEEDALCAADQSSEAVEGALPMLWCVRVSPEVEGEGGLDPDDVDVDPPEDDPEPPCGFYNLIGALDLAGSPADPRLLYCDSDASGGARLIRRAEADEAPESELIDPGVCWAEPRSGALVREGDGLRGIWVALSALHTAALGEAPVELAFESEPWRLYPLSDRLLIQDLDGALWSAPSDDLAAGALQAEVLLDGIASAGAADGGGEVAIASCASNGALQLHAFNSDGRQRWRQELGACGFDTRPSVAWSGGSWAVSWDDGEEGWLAVLSLEGVLQTSRSLGEGARYPQVAWDGDRFITASFSGGLDAWSDEGTALDAWTHPGLARFDGSPAALRLLVDAEGWMFAALGHASVGTGGGHVNTYAWLELSAIEAP